jgi:high-affinity Fe2+/Pb2+ permease
MRETKEFTNQRDGIGDNAVEGLFAGLLAGVGVGLFLLVAGLLSGNSLARLLRASGTDQPATPLGQLLTHLAITGVYGALFGVLYRLLAGLRRSGLPSWLFGLLYGVALLLITRLIVRSGMDFALQLFSWPQLIVAHLLYGLLLGVNSAFRKTG